MEAVAERKNGQKVTIPGPNIKTMLVTVEGTTSFISSAIPPHVIAELEAKNEGKAIPKAPKRSAEEQFEDSLYEHPLGGHGWKARAFKRCAREGCKDLRIASTVFERNVTMTGPGGHEMIQIEGEPEMRKDVVRNDKGAAVSCKAEFPEWSATLEVVFNENNISAEQVIHALNQGGFSTGVGGFRECFGRFRVKSAEQ